jgi:GAF domain-containing protein
MAGTQAQYERLLEAGLALAAELSLPAALQRIVELAAELTGARYGALGVLGRDGTISEFITTGVSEEQRAAIGHIPVGRGILGVLIDNAGPCGCATSPKTPARSGSHPLRVSVMPDGCDGW